MFAERSSRDHRVSRLLNRTRWRARTTSCGSGRARLRRDVVVDGRNDALRSPTRMVETKPRRLRGRDGYVIGRRAPRALGVAQFDVADDRRGQAATTTSASELVPSATTPMMRIR